MWRENFRGPKRNRPPLSGRLAFTPRGAIRRRGGSRIGLWKRSVGLASFRLDRGDAEDALNLKVKFSSSRFSMSLNGDSLTESDLISVFVRKKPNSANFGLEGIGSSVDADTYVKLQKEALFDEFFFFCTGLRGFIIASMPPS